MFIEWFLLALSSFSGTGIAYRAIVMSNAKIIDLDGFKKIQTSRKTHSEYQLYIDSLDKLDLLNEMIRYQQHRTEVGQLTPEMMTKGMVLFRALELEAESEGLRSLAGSYRRHLEHEMADHLVNQGNPNASPALDYDEDFD